MVRTILLSFVLALPSSTQTVAWHVKQQWVRAHEEFLASDLMQGRASASRDEGIAASYVGTQFESFGLKHAPGLTDYVQRIEVEKSGSDGHATITAADVKLLEGSDFYLLSSTSNSAAGLLEKTSSATYDDIHPDSLRRSKQPAGRAQPKARLIRVPPPEQVKDSNGSIGGQLVMQPRTHGSVGPLGGSSTKAILTPDAAARLDQLADDTPVFLDIQHISEPLRFTYNAIAYLPGTDPAAGTVLVSSHLDHVGVKKPVKGDAIYNGADDDASGTAAVLELARAFASLPRTRRSVLFVCFGSEELGGFGDDYFRAHPPVPLKNVVANLELEMIGAQDPKMPKGVLLFTGWDRSNLGPMLVRHGAPLGPDPYPEQNFFRRSDNYSLALKGVVAHTVTGWAMPPYYHQPDDDVAHIDVPFMTGAIQSMIAPLRWLAQSSFVPSWNPGKAPVSERE